MKDALKNIKCLIIPCEEIVGGAEEDIRVSTCDCTNGRGEFDKFDFRYPKISTHD